MENSEENMDINIWASEPECGHLGGKSRTKKCTFAQQNHAFIIINNN